MKPRSIFLFLFFLALSLTACKNIEPQPNIDLNELTIDQIHLGFELGEYTSKDLVLAYIDRIKKNDTEINAISIINPLAIQIADQLDKEYESSKKLRPLHGIPIIVKDNINTKGLPTTAGALALENFIPEEDAFIIKKLVDAGAIILAKSNMAEWAFSAMHTESSTMGTTRNPYNLAYVPAGSSGGTAASIASNFGLIGLGTDTGNSIRGPSSHCALVGFRTTLGLVSRSAIVPLYLRNDVVGPMGRTVTDATKILEVMVGEDPLDPLTSYSNGKASINYQQYLNKDGLQGVRLGVLRELSEVNVDPEVKALFEKAIEDLKKMGAIIIDPLDIPDFSELRKDQWCATFKQDVEAFLTTYVKNDSVKTLEDIIRIGTHSEFAKSRLNSFISKNDRWGSSTDPCENCYTDLRRVAFRNEIEQTMDSLKIDAIIYPTWNNKPARISAFEEEYLGDNNQIIAPHTGQPAFTVPMGFMKGNLPAGLQFLGRMYSEPLLISLSYAYEQGTLHRSPPEF